MAKDFIGCIKERTKEYKMISTDNSFYIVRKDDLDCRRLKIEYKELYYPQFVTEEAILKELKERIEKFFEEKAGIICDLEKDTIKEIILRNKREFDHFDNE